MENTKIDACTYNLYEILAKDMLYQIPNYQRPYSWDKDNIADLISDLVNAFVEQPSEEYYCGSLVLVKSNDKNGRCSVIDGQQRLTTFTLLACVIRELYSKELEPKANVLINESIKVREAFATHTSNDDKLKFLTETKFQVAFETLINNKLDFKKTDKEIKRYADKKYIDENGIYFRNAYYIKEALDDSISEHNIKINEFIEWLYEKVVLTMITCSNDESAIRIFNVLNNRGMPLSPTDILKSELMGKLSDDKRDGFKSKWEIIERDLQFCDCKIEDMLIAYLYCITARNPKNRFDKELLDTNEFKMDSIQIINNMDKFKRCYIEVLETKDEYINCLKCLPHRIYWTSILATAKYIKYSEYDSLKKVILAYYYQNFIAGFAVDKFKQTSFNILDELKKQKSVADIKGIMLENINKINTTDKYKANIVSEQVFGYKWVKPVLLMVEYFYYRDDNPKIEFIEMNSQLHLEHILPQTMPDKEQYKQHYEYWANLFTEEQREKWTNSLANLTLLRYRKNIQAQNYDFPTKKDIYKNGDGVITCFGSTKELLKEKQWSETELKARKEKLLDFINKIIDIF